MKINLMILAGVLCLTSYTGNTQEKSDIGVWFSNNNLNRMGIAFRTGLNEQYKLRAGASWGQETWSNRRGYFDNIVSASDSLIVSQRNYIIQSRINTRIGVERRLKASPFSVGADVILGYHSYYTGQYLSPYVLGTDGNWREGYYLNETIEQDNGSNVTPYIVGDNEFATATHHYISPGLRLTTSADIPLGKMFILNFTLASQLTGDIYLATTNSNSAALSNPGTRINLDLMGQMGLRYVIGSFKNRKKN